MLLLQSTYYQCFEYLRGHFCNFQSSYMFKTNNNINLLCHSTWQKKIVNRPLAGTIKRGKTTLEDEMLEMMMLKDEKQCAEHIMLVDLGRNDIGKVSPYLFNCKRYREKILRSKYWQCVIYSCFVLIFSHRFFLFLFIAISIVSMKISASKCGTHNLYVHFLPLLSVCLLFLLAKTYI